jgi:hypothetical protein
MDIFSFFFSKSATATSTSPASEPLTTQSPSRSTYDTFCEKSTRGHRKAIFDRVPDSEPRGRSMSRTTSSRRGGDGSGVASLDLILLLDRHGYFS